MKGKVIEFLLDEKPMRFSSIICLLLAAPWEIYYFWMILRGVDPSPFVVALIRLVTPATPVIAVIIFYFMARVIHHWAAAPLAAMNRLSWMAIGGALGPIGALLYYWFVFRKVPLHDRG